MNRERKLKYYAWLVKGLGGVLATWAGQMTQPVRDGTFNDWERAETHGKYITTLMDELAALAYEFDPTSVKIWMDMKQDIINMRIKAYNIMRRLEVPDLPPPTPEELAADEVERQEALRTGGLSLIQNPPIWLRDEHGMAD